MEKMFKTIIFDFDGTIADTFDLLFDALNANAKKFGIKNIDPSNISRLKNSTLRDLIDEFELGISKISFALKFARKKIEENIEEVPAFDGIIDMLKELKNAGNFQLGILTSNSKVAVKEFLKNNNALDYFDFISSESSVFGKQRALKRLAKRYNLKTSEILYVGDEIRDISGAKKANIKVAVVSWGYNSKELLKKYDPDFFIQNPQDLLAILIK